MKQVVVIGGGEVFKTHEEYLNFLREMKIDPFEERTRGWKSNLEEDLGPDYQILRISMPTPLNAKYDEWKLWFEKHIPFMKDDVILLGHSLGGLFLVKYLEENELPVRVKGTFLVATPFAKIGGSHGLEGFAWSGLNYLRDFKSRAGTVFFYHGRNDDIVPSSDYDQYRLLVKTTPRLFPDRGHFIFDEHFTELVRDIKQLT